MKTLTENRIKNIAGFRRAPEFDFRDDGSAFTGWIYKGLPLTQHRDPRFGTYLSFRVDYISHEKGFTYYDYSNTSWYPLCDKYNGVRELPEIEEIVKDLEVVVAGIKELEKKVKNEVLDYSELVEHAKAEIKFAEDSLNDFKLKFVWWNCESEWDLKSAKRYIEYTQREIERLKKLVANPEADSNIRNRVQSFQKNGYVMFKNDDYYLEKMKELLAKQAA